ncbi:tetratricopeptide repeat protein [Azospirillum endophyticum]
MIGLPDLIRNAVSLHQSNRLFEAAIIYKKVLDNFPDNPDALHLLGLARHRMGESVAGIRLMEKALEHSPTLPGARFNLANAYFETGRFEEAEATFRIFLSHNPGHSSALSAMGRLLLRRGALDEAKAAFDQVCTESNDARLRLAQQRICQYRKVMKAAQDASLPSGIVVRGVYRDSSGYAYTVRQFVRHLIASGIKVHLMDLCYAPMDHLSLDQIDPLFQSLTEPVRAKAILNFTTPVAVEAVPGLKTIAYTMFEATRIPALWTAHSRQHDHTIVATPSSRDAWIASGQRADQVSICPAGVDPIDEKSVAKLDVVDPFGRRLSSYPTRILNVSDFNDRKNLRGILRTWLRNTNAVDPAALVLKVGKASGTSDAFRALVDETTRGSGIPLSAAAPIFLIDGKLSDKEILSLFATCTHYWSMSHGEGWDLPMTQAGAMGLTLIAPQHSAYTAYLDDKVAHLLPCSVGPATGSYSGLEWWFPDEAAAGELLQRIIHSPEACHRSAQNHLRTNLSWEVSTGRLIDTLVSFGAIR